MSFLPSTSAEDVIGQPARAQFEAFLDEHRGDLNHCLDGLTEEQARRSLVPSGADRRSSCGNHGWLSPDVAWRLRALAPRLAPPSR